MSQPLPPTRTNLHQSLRFGRLIVASIVVYALNLVGCNGTSLSDITQSNQADNEDTVCYKLNKPFKHSLCSVAQDDLSGDDRNLALRLFWKAKDAASLGNVTEYDATKEDLSEAEDASPLYKFDTLLANLPANDTLKFAANAGMYNSEFAPIGYTVIRGKEIRSLNLKAGGGNFHLLPNGVLWWDKAGKVQVTESHTLSDMLASGDAKPWFATQSGPMLVIDGQIHPKFKPNSKSQKFRNGVGVCADGQIKFVNSDEMVNFYNFAALFKDELNCPNALFLDGGIASALYAPDIKQKDDKNMGVMIGVVETKE